MQPPYVTLCRKYATARVRPFFFCNEAASADSARACATLREHNFFVLFYTFHLLLKCTVSILYGVASSNGIRLLFADARMLTSFGG